MTTVPQIISLLGGNTRFAAVIGKGASTVSEMKRSGSIPVRYWPAILDEAKAKGLPIDSDVLVAANTARRPQAGSPVFAHGNGNAATAAPDAGEAA